MWIARHRAGAELKDTHGDKSAAALAGPLSHHLQLGHNVEVFVVSVLQESHPGHELCRQWRSHARTPTDVTRTLAECMLQAAPLLRHLQQVGRGLIAGGPITSKRIPARMCLAGSSLLSRARQVGPHSFVELSLFPSDPVLEAAVPPLKTPFQAQTFCPEFHHCRRLQTVLDARMVRAFTTQVGHVLVCLAAHAGP